MTNLQRAAARLSLIFSALVAGVLNGSPLAAPILILTAYLLCVLVDQAHTAAALYQAQRLKEIRNAAALAR